MRKRTDGGEHVAVQLYTHSDYSLLESTLTVEELVKHGARLGFSSLALTDHNSTAGHWEFQRCCREAGLKPIFGLELDVIVFPGTKPCQVVLLALDNQGYSNLLSLASLQPPVSREDLARHQAGLALLEGGRSGALTALGAAGRLSQAQELHGWYAAQFADNYYVRHEVGQDFDLWSLFPEARFVLCQDVRYAEVSSAETLEVLAALRGGEPKAGLLPMLSWGELCARVEDGGTMAANALQLAERCQVDLPRERGFTLKIGGPSLEERALEGARLRFGELSFEVQARLEYELKVITERGFANYFLLVADLVRFAKQTGIPVGPGRGSAAGSLVAYVLGITEVNPLEWGLVFERFLNPERRSKPDIDVDFCYERRSEVLAYALECFGRERVAQIGTYGTFGPKSAAQEVRRILGRDNPRVTAEIQDLKRHRSTHAAGIIVSERPIREFSAVYSDRNVPVTQLDMYSLEELGALKIDLLGLRTLTLLRSMELEVQRREPGFSLEKVPLHDEQTLRLLGQGLSLGIFQLESELFRELLQELKPQSFPDIVALLALGRPGPLSMFREFAARRKDPGRITYDHPALKDILAETYGLILYQEQVMAIAHRLGGLSLGEADLLRRDLAAGDPKAVQGWRERFLQGAQERGVDLSTAQLIFQNIAQFSGYAFNKSHSVCYALLSWRAAFLKAHYPEVFYLVLLNEGASGKEQQAILAEAKILGVEIRLPSVLHSEAKAVLEGKGLRLGLSTSRQISPQVAQEIAARRRGRSWTSPAQFSRTLGLDRSLLETLVLMGAFDDLGERNRILVELGFSPRPALELLRKEREVWGVYLSMHPCSPFSYLVEKLRGDLEAALGEVITISGQGKQYQGVIDTPTGWLTFRGQVGRGQGILRPGSRVALFGRQGEGELFVEWLLPLGPILLITPDRPEDLEAIREVLQGGRGSKPVILLLGEAYHVLPAEFWVSDGQGVGQALARAGIVYTWFDPWKENA